jgi:hypothetical protein
VPVDDGGESSRFRVEVEVFQPMKHIQQNVANPDDFADRQRLGPRTVVDIPADGDRRGDGSEALEHVGIANVPRMNDQL